MKKAVSLLALMGLFFTGNALASNLKIGVFNLQVALASDKDVKKEFELINKDLSADKSRVEALASEIKKLQDKLKKNASIMSDAEKRKTGQQIEEKAQEFQFLGARLQQTFQVRQQEILQKHMPKIQSIIEAVIKEEKLDLLLERQAVAFAVPKIDITGKIIAKMEQKAKKKK